MGRGRAPCCDKTKVRTGPWSPAEDAKLMNFIQSHGHTNWRALPKQAGLMRCGKSCRLRWINYLRPDVKRGNFTAEEENTIIQLHFSFGSKWSKIASCLPGRTDNEIKNMWNTHLKKRLVTIETDNPRRMHYSACASSSITTCADENTEKLVNDESNPSDDGKPDIRPDYDIDLWEMLDSLDPLQSNKTAEIVEERSDGEFRVGKWLKFTENELGLTSDVDQQMMVKPNEEMSLEPEISSAFDFSPLGASSPPHFLGI